MKKKKKQKQIVNLKCANDSEFLGCGPDEGSYVTELTYIDENGLFFFITVSRFMEFVKICLKISAVRPCIIRNTSGC